MQAILIALCFVPLQQPPAAGEPVLEQVERELSKVVDAARRSVVRVVVTRPVQIQPGAAIDETLSFTGVVYSADGYVLTDASGVDGAAAVDVRIGDSDGRKAKLVGSDARTGLAVLKVDAAGL